MLKLYGAPFTRSSFIQWYFEELEVPYEFVAFDYQAGSFHNPPPEFFTVNPMGKTPAIVDGNFKLWESGAILLYLAEKYNKLPAALEQRAVITQWVFFASSTLGPLALVPPPIFAAEGREQQVPRFLMPMNQILKEQSFITGDKLTVADVTLGFVLICLQDLHQLDLSHYPAVASYIQRLMERPAFQSAFRSLNLVNN